jgi:hypothetical protein
MKCGSFHTPLIINRSVVFPGKQTAVGLSIKCGILTQLLEVSWPLSPGAMRVDCQFILRSVGNVSYAILQLRACRRERFYV